MARKATCNGCGKKFDDGLEKCPFCKRANLATAVCKGCGTEIAIVLDQCKHCGTTSFPNVTMAEQLPEVEALGRRYKKASRIAEKRGAQDQLKDFEAVAEQTVAVIARSRLETERLADGDNEIYSSYYSLVEAEVVRTGYLHETG